MAAIFSKACGYAFRGLVEMARNETIHSWHVHELAEKTDTPAPFLAKTFQVLVAGGVLKSTKGRGGGFSLAREPGKILLIEIVKIIDGTALTENCVLGFPNCSDENPCSFHNQWAVIRKSLVDILTRQSLLDLSQTGSLIK